MTAPTLQRSPAVARFALYTALLFASFHFDVFGLVGGLRGRHLGYDSHLVLNRIKFAAEKMPWWHPNYLLTDTGKLAYGSQMGLQGMMLGEIHERLGGDPRLFVFRVAMLWSLLTAAVLACFFTSVAGRFGPIAGGVAVLLTSLSPILLEFSTSLFWCAFLLFAPFVFTWIAYERLSQSWRGLLALHAGVAALVALKCTTGYEYFTSVALSPLAAVAFHRASRVRNDEPISASGDSRETEVPHYEPPHEVPQKQGGWRSWMPFLTLAAAGMSGMMFTLALHSVQLSWLLGTSGFDAIMGVATRQTVAASDLRIFDFSHTPLRFLPESIGYPLNCFFNYFNLPAFVLPRGWFGDGVRVSTTSVTVATLAFLLEAALRRRAVSPRCGGLAAAVGVSLVTSLSWQVVARNHMCVHLHLNHVVFFLPLLLLVYVAFGYGAQRLLERCKLSSAVCALGLPLLLVFVGGSVARSLHASTCGQLSAWDGALVAQHRVAAYLQGAWPGQPGVLGCIDAIQDFELYDLTTRELHRSALGAGTANRNACLFTGWVIDTAEPEAPKGFVVLQAGRLYPAVQAEFFERDDVEKHLKLFGPRAGYKFWVSLPVSPAVEKPRAFVVTGSEGGKVLELPGP